MSKIYEVLIERRTAEYTYIEAEDADNAAEIARELMQEGVLEYAKSYEPFEDSIADVHEHEPAGDDSEERNVAESNRSAYLDITS